MPRRAKGTGSIRKRGKDRWQLRFDGPPDEDGNLTKIAETVVGSRRDAERVLRDRLGVIEDGSYVSKNKVTVREFMQQWLDTYAGTNTRPSTLQGYRSKIRTYINSSFGEVHLQNLRPAHIQKMLADMLARGLSQKTTRDTYMIIKEALSHAIKWGLLNVNPADAVTPPKRRRQEMKMWDVPTIHVFLNAAKKERYGDLYHLAILTGMRRAELLGLRWEHVNLDESWLSVYSTIQRLTGRGVVTGSPKTDQSRRTIALSKGAVELLKETRTRQLEARLKAGPLWEANDLVFCQINGKSFHPNRVSNDFAAIVRKTGSPHLTLKGLRHAHATLLLSAGVHPKIVSERLGHSNISVTMDIYSHVMPGMQEMAAQAIDDRLANQG